MSAFELRCVRALTRALPRVRGAGVVGNGLIRWYNRRPRERVRSRVHGFVMELDPAENVDGQLLFQPQLYDRREFAELDASLPEGGTFVDVGAHIGTYALHAAARTGKRGQVLAIEADPVNAGRLRANLALNPELSARVRVHHGGVSDRDEILPLTLNTGGNRSGNSFLAGTGETIDVRCRPLAEVLAAHGFGRVDAMKIDIEGFEYRVLRRFFEDAAPDEWPGTLVLEYQPAWDEAAGGSSLELVRSRGYRERLRAGINRVLVRDDGGGR